MLEHCADGHTIRKNQEYYIVGFGGLTYRSLPVGAHGSRRPAVHALHIRKLVRFLRIDADCVERHLGSLS